MTRIVLVDDEPLVRDSYARLLEVDGFETACFESAEDFLAESGYVDADCLIVDYRLKGMTGCEMLRTLRQKGVNTPAILLSGNIDETESSFLNGIDYVQLLGKPCRAEHLYECVERACEMHT